jgi:hypothetical protein
MMASQVLVSAADDASVFTGIQVEIVPEFSETVWSKRELEDALFSLDGFQKLTLQIPVDLFLRSTEHRLAVWRDDKQITVCFIG